MVARSKLVKIKNKYKLVTSKKPGPSPGRKMVAASPGRRPPTGMQFNSIREWLLHRKKAYGSLLSERCAPALTPMEDLSNMDLSNMDPKEIARREKEIAKEQEKRKKLMEREEAKRVKEKEREEAKKARDKEREEKRQLRRYPMEDSKLVDLGEAGEEPPCGDPLYIKNGFPTELWPELLMVCEGCRVLEEIEGSELQGLSLDILRDSLLGGGSQKGLQELHIKLTKSVVAECEEEAVCGCSFEELPVDAVNWAEVLRQYLLTIDVAGRDVTSVCEMLECHEPCELSLRQGLQVLSLLVNLAMDTDEVREHLNKLNDQTQEVRGEWWKLRGERREKLKEAQGNVKKAADAANAANLFV